MKREVKVVIIGVIRLSIAIGLGVFGLIAGQGGWACMMFIVAVFMGIDSYRSYKNEAVDDEDEYSKINRMQDMIDDYHHNNVSTDNDHDMPDDRD